MPNPLRRLFQDAGMILSGNAIGSVLGLVTLGLTARALGPDQLGVLVLIKAYVSLVEQFATFHAWPALITHGTQLLEQGRRDDFKRLMKFGVVVDAVGAVLGAVGGAAAAYWFGRWRGWDPDTVRMAVVYSLTLFGSLTGTPKAILRLFGRFQAFAMQGVIAAGVKLAGVVTVFLLHGGLTAFVGVWMLTELIGNGVVVALGSQELHRQGFRGILGTSARGIRARCPGLWGFVWTTNINTTIKSASQEADVLIIGGLLGPREAGFYKIIKQCAKLVSQVTDPLQQVLYPEVARLWAKRQIAQIRKTIGRISAVGMGTAAIAWVGLFVAGRAFLALAFGPAFVDAHEALLWYMAAIAVMVGTFPMAVALTSTGHYKASFWINIVSTALYLPTLWWFVVAAGLVGASMASLANQLLRTLLVGRSLKVGLAHAVPSTTATVPAAESMLEAGAS